MATTIVMPQMGYDMREGRVVQWLKREGDAVSRGEDLVEIETDKAVIPMTATASGILRKILVEEGITVPVGQTIGVVTDPEEALPDDLEQRVQQAEAPPKADETALPSTPVPKAVTEVASAVRASPVARRLAQEKRIDLTQVSGTGPSGRITERDIHAFAETLTAEPASQPVAAEGVPEAAAAHALTQTVPLSRMRQAIARLTTRSKQETPHFYLTTEVDMTAAMALRNELNPALASQNIRVGLNDLLIRACALALGNHPNLNASFGQEQIEIHSAINIGIAIDLGERGLIVPALMSCESLSLMEIAVASRDLVERARADHLQAEELSSTTFSISNLGMFDIDAFAAIIYPPNSAVLAVGTVRPRPLVRDSQVVVAQTMHATLSVDHRVTDGAGAARFLSEVKTLLERATRLQV